jgi:hypothetical protein
MNAYYCSNLTFTNSVSDKGATVEGGESKQTFMTVSDFDVNPEPVVIELELRAPRDRATSEPKRNYCGGCGVRRRRRDRFCPQCGNKH